MRPIARATTRVLTRKTEDADRRRQLLLIASAASALALCSLGMARADTVVTVNADGSVTRTQTASRAAMPAQGAILNNGQYSGHDQLPVHNPALSTPGAHVNAGTTTFFSGTYYPVPQNYYYGYPQPQYYAPPQGYTYPVGPIYPRVTPPMITAGPAISSRVPYHHCPYYGHCAPPRVQYPAYSYPAYGMNGVYYHGPAGGGGTIYSNSTTRNSGSGLSLGRGGVNVRIGGSKRTSNSTTTVTTTGPR